MAMNSEEAMSQSSVCSLKFGPNLKHPFLFCICKLKNMQRKCRDPQSSTESTVARQEPQTLHYPPGTLICTWDIHMEAMYMNLSPGKPSRVGDVCYCSEAPLTIALFPKASMVICLSPAHSPCL